jgi:hypothetical protein
MSDGHHSSAAIKPLRGSRVVEGGSFAVQLHVSRVNTRAENPWVVEIVLSALNQEDLEVVIQVGQSASNDATTSSEVSACPDGTSYIHLRSSSTHNDIDLMAVRF